MALTISRGSHSEVHGGLGGNGGERRLIAAGGGVASGSVITADRVDSRGPQSSQSVPSSQLLYSRPGPPSSQSASFAYLQVFVHCEATGLACIPSSSITTSHLQRRGDAEVSFPIGPGEPPMMYVETRALQGSASIRTAAIIEMPIRVLVRPAGSLIPSLMDMAAGCASHSEDL